jgi:hypothetical protein
MHKEGKMINPEVKLTLKLKGDKPDQEGMLKFKAGASTLIKFEDLDAAFNMNYENPDSLIATIKGKFRFVDTGEKEFSVTGSISRDFLSDKNIYEGELSLEFNKNISTNLDLAYDTKDGMSYVAGLKIQF